MCIARRMAALPGAGCVAHPPLTCHAASPPSPPPFPFRLDEVMAEDVKELYRKEERLKQVRARRAGSNCDADQACH